MAFTFMVSQYLRTKEHILNLQVYKGLRIITRLNHFVDVRSLQVTQLAVAFKTSFRGA